MQGAPSRVFLNYARRPRRSRRNWKGTRRGLSICLVVAIIAGVWFYWPDIIHRVRLWYDGRACMAFRTDLGIAYCEGARTTPLTRDRSYETPPLWASPAGPARGLVPAPWKDLNREWRSSGSMEPILFMGKMRTDSGEDWLVVARLAGIQSYGGSIGRRFRIEFILADESCFRLLGNGGSSSVSSFENPAGMFPEGADVTIYSGEADPSAKNHFSIKIEYEGMTYYVDAQFVDKYYGRTVSPWIEAKMRPAGP